MIRVISLIIVTHGPLSKSLVDSAKIISGDFTNVSTFSLNPGDNIGDFEKEVLERIAKESRTSQVLVLTDIPGGSPTNISAIALQELDFECLTGVNLPMVLEAILTKDSVLDFEQYVQQVMDAGKNSILNLKQLVAF